MRPESCGDCTVPVFTLSSPGYIETSPEHEGRLRFTLNEDVTAEIDHADLLESWASAATLSVADAMRMTAEAGRHLASLLEGGLAGADLTSAVTDAAVVLLLALRRAGVSRPERIPACTIRWNGRETAERVLIGA